MTIDPTSNTQSSNPASSDTTNSTATSSTDKLANEQTFLQLFVSQLQNQDPLNPADGTQFVTQLAQFSELEQVINIGQDIGAIRQQVAPDTSSTSVAQTSSAS